MSARLRIGIVGGGIAGAALARVLARRGHAVELFERGSGSAGGAGLLLAPPALALLRGLGLEEAVRSCGAVVYGIRARQAHGAPLLDWDARRCGYAALGLGLQRSALHALLLQGLTSHVVVRQGLDIAAVDAATGCLSDSAGTVWGPYDLVVASDGAGSRLRGHQPALVAQQHRYDWTAFSALLRAPAGAAARTTLEQSFRGAHHVSSWPVGPAQPDGQPVCVSVNVPAAAAPQFCTPEQGMAELQRLGLARCPALQSLQVQGPWIALSCREVALHRLYCQRLVFVGDAAHSLSPQLGQGARLALAGAVNLADALDGGHVPAALDAYDRRQRALAADYQRLSRVLTPLLQSPPSGLQWLRNGAIGTLSRLGPVQRAALRLLCGPAPASASPGASAATADSASL